MHDTDVIVIGAGAAGVAAARALHDARVPVVLLEARDRIGGRAWTFRASDLPLDLGCGWLHSAGRNEWAAHAQALGLTVDRSTPPWQRRAIAVNFSSDEQLDYAAARERFYDRAEAEPDSARRMSEFLEPGSRWNPLLNAMSTYINGVTFDHLVAREYALYEDDEVNWRVVEGYGALIEAYARPLDVRLNCPVTLIDHSGARVRVVTPRGELSARAVIVATPPGVMANEFLRFSPALPDKHDAATQLPLGLADKVFLALDRADDLPRDTRLFGATDRTETGSYTLRAFGRPVVEGYFGGDFARTLEAEDAFVPFAIEQIASALGNDMRKRLSGIAASAWAHDPYALGSYSYGKDGAQGCARGSPRRSTGGCSSPASIVRSAISPPRMARTAPACTRPKPPSGHCKLGRRDGRKAVARPRQRAGLIARQTVAAHLRPHRIDRACGRNTDLAGQRHAAVARAAHRPARVIDQRLRDRLDLGFAFQPEARPVARIGATGAACLTRRVEARHYFSSSSSSIATPPASVSSAVSPSSISATSASSFASASSATPGASASFSVPMWFADCAAGSYALRGA